MERTDGNISYNDEMGEHNRVLFTYNEEERQENEINKANAKLVFSPKFIPVYTELLGKLTPIECMLFGFIDFYKSNSSTKFYFTNEQLSIILKCSIDTISRGISNLEKLGYIETSRKIKSGGGQIRFITNVLHKSDTANSYFHDTTFSSSQTTEKLQTNNNKINNNNINNNKIKIYFQNEKINNLFNEYLSIRKKGTNKDITINKLVKRLNKYSTPEQIDILENSIRNGRQGLFEPKQKTKFKSDNQIRYEQTRPMELPPDDVINF